MNGIAEFVSSPAYNNIIIPTLGILACGGSLGLLGYVVFGHPLKGKPSVYEDWKNKRREPKQLEFNFNKYPK